MKNLSSFNQSSSNNELTVSQWMPRFYYSHYHLTAAAFFARQSAQIERNNSASGDAGSSEDFLQHRAYVTGCIFASVSFLEAQINEVFTDASEDKRDFIHPLETVYSFSQKCGDSMFRERHRFRS